MKAQRAEGRFIVVDNKWPDIDIERVESASSAKAVGAVGAVLAKPGRGRVPTRPANQLDYYCA